jgi:hypothetical protein
MVVGVVSLSSAPVAIARARGFYADEGVDLDWQLVQGGVATVAALSGSDAQFAEGGATDIIGLNARNLPVLGVISLVNRIFFDTIVAKPYVDLGMDAYPRDGKMSQAMGANAMKVLTESGAIPRALDTQEGVLWTNQFLK